MPADRPTALIAYDGLPIAAGGGHGLGRKDRSVVWNEIRQFLQTCTTCRAPQRVRLLLSEGTHLDADFFARASRAATDSFGRPQRRLAIVGADGEVYEHAWEVDPEEIDRALALMQGVEPIPEHLGSGVLVLAVEASFCLRDPDSGEPFPGQDPALYGHQEAAWNLPLGLSRIYLRLSGRSTCALFLSLPFPAVSPELRGHVAELEALLPFRLSPKHWSRWQLNAQGTRYYKRRVIPPTEW
jgi:hypothetical protein